MLKLHFPKKSGNGFNLVNPEGMRMTGHILMLERSAWEPESVAKVFQDAH
jgi:hypothetical protein